MDVSRLALRGDVRSLRQKVRNLLRKNGSTGLSEPARHYLADLLASVEPITPPRSGSPLARVAGAAATTPADGDLALATRRDDPAAAAPVLAPPLAAQLERIIREHEQRQRLADMALKPTARLLLAGAPGTGKTMTATWLATRLRLPLLHAEPAAVMNSLLGQSARNLARVFEHARAAPCVLLLDEFDAYARRRDDQGDIAEPKRLVNTLLLELERWPAEGLLVAATNHPDLLDPATARRFDVRLDLTPPTAPARREVLVRALAASGTPVTDPVLDALAHASNGMTGSDLRAAVETALRRHVLDEVALEAALAETLIAGRLAGRSATDRRARGAFARVVRDELGLSHRQIAELLGVSHVTVGELLRGRAEGKP